MVDKWQERDEAEMDLAYEAYMDHLADVYADQAQAHDEMYGRDPDDFPPGNGPAAPQQMSLVVEPDVSESLHDLGDLAGRVSKLEASSPHMATKAEIEQVRTEFVSALSRNQKWIIGGVITTLVAVIGGLVSFIIALFQALGAS